MPSSSRGLIRTDAGIHIRGLTELQRALKRAPGDTRKRLRKELRDIANDVRDTARTYVPHKTGRHGGADVPHLAPSIRSRTVDKGASVYSDAPQAIVQDVGGQVGHGAIISRASASHYMSQAVRDAQPYVNRRLDELLDDLGRNFERG